MNRFYGGTRNGRPNPTALVAAWVNANPMTPTIHAAHNVSSVTRNTTGTYTVTWTIPFSPDGGYPLSAICRMDADAIGGTVGLVGSPTTTSAQVATLDANGGPLVDIEVLHIIAWEKR